MLATGLPAADSPLPYFLERLVERLSSRYLVEVPTTMGGKGLPAKRDSVSSPLRRNGNLRERTTVFTPKDVVALTRHSLSQ